MIFSFWNKLQKSLFCQTELEPASALHCCRQLLCNWQGTDWFCKFLKQPFQSALCPHANLSDRLLTDVVRLGRHKLILPSGFVVSKGSYRNEDTILPFNLSAVAQRHVFAGKYEILYAWFKRSVKSNPKAACIFSHAVECIKVGFRFGCKSLHTSCMALSPISPLVRILLWKTLQRANWISWGKHF